MPTVLYLDRYHLGDPLFLTGFARDVLAFVEPVALVHGSGEAAERALEAQGRIPAYEGGVIAAETDEDRALVERAARDLNRTIVHTLNDAGVAAVGVEAGSRGLVKAAETGLAAKNVGWFGELLAQRAVPVVAALVSGAPGEPREVSGGAVAGLLAGALSREGDAVLVAFLSKRGSGIPETAVSDGEGLLFEDLPEGVLPEPEAVQAALSVGADVRLVERAALRGGRLGGVRLLSSVDNKSA